MLKHLEPFPRSSRATAHHSKSWIFTAHLCFAFHQSPKKCLCYAQILDGSCFKQHTFALCVPFSNHGSCMVQRCFLRHWNWWTGIPKAEITHVYISDSPHTWDLHIKQGILTKYSDFRSLLFFWGTKPNWNSSMWTELQFSSKTANSFAGKGLVHFSENFWNNFFCWYESWQGTSFNLSLSQKPQLQDVVIYLHWKVENCRRKKSFPKATLEADSIDKFSLHDSRNCFTENLWGEV